MRPYIVGDVMESPQKRSVGGPGTGEVFEQLSPGPAAKAGAAGMQGPSSNPATSQTTPGMTGAGERIVVLEIGRPILEEVRAQLGEPFAVVSYPRPVLEAEYPQILREAYQAIRRAASGGNIVILVLSGPLALSFQLGQLVGLSHYKILVYQFSGGRYRAVPPVSREVMF